MAENKSNNEARFEIVTRTGEKLKLDKATVMKYLTDNKEISDSEFNMFFQLCKVNKVNPFLKEAYIIKYGSSPATIVLDYKVLQQIAEDNPAYRGMRHGVVVTNDKGEVTERLGEYKLPGETLIAGWCEVYRKDRRFYYLSRGGIRPYKGADRRGEEKASYCHERAL